MAIRIQQWEDPTTWNSFVATTPHAHFQQSWEWGQLAPYLGGKAIRLAATENGSFRAAMQLFVTPVGHSNHRMLYVPRGPATSNPGVELLGPLLDAGRLLGMQEHALGLRLEPNMPHSAGDQRTALESLGFRPTYPPSQPRSSWMLDLSPDADTLLGQMKQKTRYNIRLAARKGVDIVQARESDLDAFYGLYEETARRDDFFIHPKSFYASMFSLFRAAGNFCMLLAQYRGQILAAVTLLRFGPTCWYMQGASSNEHRNLMAPHLLQWEAIRWAKEQGCTLYDFRAVPDLLREDQDMYGVYRFKEGFGGFQFTTMHTYATPYNPLLFGLWQLYFSGRFAVNAAQRRRKGLPARQFA